MASYFMAFSALQIEYYVFYSVCYNMYPLKGFDQMNLFNEIFSVKLKYTRLQ